jgi:hypothetical protein
LQAAKSFFADTVHDNLIVKVSDIHVELDIFTDVDSDVAQQASDEEVPAKSVVCMFSSHIMRQLGVICCHSHCSWSVIHCAC